jgi:large subunit ribosomal protein L22
MARKSKKETLEMASASATLRHVRLSAQKARLVINLVKGKQVEPALQILQYSPKKGAVLVEKLLRSAIANAREVAGLDVDKLWVTGAWVNEGPTMKRFMPRARGSADQIRKRSSHITVVVGEKN